MGVIVGLVLGAGVLLIWLSFLPQAPRVSRPRPHPLQDLLTQAGWYGVPRHLFVAISAGFALLTGAFTVLLTNSFSIAGAFTVIAAGLPTVVVRARAAKRRSELRLQWPDAIDDLLSSVRAGMSLPEALGALGERGPLEMREPLQAFAIDYQVTARFDESLDLLKNRFADPVADRVIEALRLTREVGGTDLGTTLRALASMLREDQRTRGELLARQSWTVNSARLAVSAPWVVLALLALRSESVTAFDSAAGVLVLMIGALASGLAYVLMIRIGKLPEERRVLR